MKILEILEIKKIRKSGTNHVVAKVSVEIKVKKLVPFLYIFRRNETFIEVVEKAAYLDNYAVNWRWADTGEFTPGSEMEDLYSAWKHAKIIEENNV